MSILSILGKGLKAMIDEAYTPESFKVGQKFEDYVLSSLKPDFKFRDRWTKKEFYVEVKFRSSNFNGKIVWCNDKQLARYQEYNRERPVFLLLGMGDDSKHPEFISLIPLSQAKYTGLFPSHVEKFKIERDKPIFSKILWER